MLVQGAATTEPSRKGLDSLLIVDRILSLIEHYGYLVILFGVMLESTGVPLPGETILPSAGVLVQRGHLRPWRYHSLRDRGGGGGRPDRLLGRTQGGRPFVLRWGRYLFITPERLGRAEAFFERHGGRPSSWRASLSGLRVFGALVAGMSRMRWGTFLIYNALGGAVWATAVVLVGYFLGQQPRARSAVAGQGHAGARRVDRLGGRLLPGLPLGRP